MFLYGGVENLTQGVLFGYKYKFSRIDAYFRLIKSQKEREKENIID